MKSLFDSAKRTIFSEPQTDIVSEKLTVAADEQVFAVEYLPNQFDQRADSAAQCIQLISRGDRPVVKTARVYLLGDGISGGQLDAVKKYVINQVESREASLAQPATLALLCAAPGRVEVLNGFCRLEGSDLREFAAKHLRAAGKLDNLDESEEVNASTVKITVLVDGRYEGRLLLFKNEIHNHPTEIEPFDGEAISIGGAIRDSLSGRAYVYAAMRLTGAGDLLALVNETLPGKLPQRKIG